MNNLFSSSWRRDSDIRSTELTRNQSFGSAEATSGGANLDKFFFDVESIKEELKLIDLLHRSLHEANESSKTLHNAKQIKALRLKMDADVASCLKKAKVIKVKVEALDRANAANRTVEGCGPGSSTDRTRVSVVSGLRKKLKDQMEGFQELRKEIGNEYKETIQRRYYTVTGEQPSEDMVETLISTGEGERFLQRAIEQQGRGQVVDTIAEIQERHTATTELEKSLLELQQVFMDMSVLVAAQGEQLDDIESQVGRAKSFVNRGTGQLVEARKSQRSTRRWTCYAIILLLIIVLIIVVPIVVSQSSKK